MTTPTRRERQDAAEQHQWAVIVLRPVLLCIGIAAAGCDVQPPSNSESLETYQTELARLGKMQAERQELADHYQLTLRQVSEARQGLREIHQQRIDLRANAELPRGVEDMRAFDGDMDEQLAPQLVKVRAEYDAAMQKIDQAIKQQDDRVQKAKDRARI